MSGKLRPLSHAQNCDKDIHRAQTVKRCLDNGHDAAEHGERRDDPSEYYV